MSDGDFEDEKYSLADTLADMKETKKITIYNEGQCFGDMDNLTGDRWNQDNCIFPLTDTLLLMIDSRKLNLLYLKHFRSRVYQEYLGMLS